MPEHKLVVNGGKMVLKPGVGWSLVPPLTSHITPISTPSGAAKVGGVPLAKESDLTGQLASTITIPYVAGAFTFPGTLKVTSITVTNNSGRVLTLNDQPLVSDAAEGSFQATIVLQASTPPATPPVVTDPVPTKSGTWSIGDAGQTALTLA
jgi:Contractile injection system spike tip protein